MDAGQEEADKLLARVSKLVVKPRDKALHGEKVTLKKVGDGSLVEVTVSTKKPVGKAYFQSRALNIAGMKLLKAGSLDAAQKKFVEATEADDTYSIAMYLTLAAKNKSTIRIAWEVFSDGFFDADAFVDDKPVRLQKLASIATISKKISSK